MSAKVSVAPARCEVEYTEALKRIDELFDAPVGTPEFSEFDILTILLHDYEQRHYPVGQSPSDLTCQTIRLPS